MRKELLIKDEIYHIFTRSISDYIIFNRENDFQRMLQLIRYYQIEKETKFSYFIRQVFVEKNGFNNALQIVSKNEQKMVQIIAYCLMPTHVHLILKQITENGISEFMRKVLDGYTRYFNILYKRKGPLWESKFKNVLVNNDEQLTHLIRYIHLNPTTANLVQIPENWVFSSYREYLDNVEKNQAICEFSNIFTIDHWTYKKFTNNQIAYQKELGEIKKILLE